MTDVDDDFGFNRYGRRTMSALTQETMYLVRKKPTPAQAEERRREAEKILGRRLPPAATPVTTDK
ncbi:hypothetical protein AB0N05_24620 [Nocardia sp. NPDC051030]|uniref:hypothetical protein n=1 Tax=Nocardia sp. NPDC051030 TaxID=3155162 RepID=UPI003439FA67